MNKDLMNLEEVITESGVLDLLGAFSFSIKDYNSKELFKSETSLTNVKRNSVIYQDNEYYQIFCDQSIFSIIEPLIIQTIERKILFTKSESWVYQNQIITNDLLSTLVKSENINLELDSIFTDLITYLRAHTLCDDVFYYTIDKGHTIKFKSGILKGKLVNKIKDLNRSFLLIAQIAACSKKIFQIDRQVNREELNKYFYNDESVNNILVFPIIHEEMLLGVFQLVNKKLNTYTNQDIDLVRRFSRFTGHILKENYQNNVLLKSERMTEELSHYLSRNVFENIKEKGLENLGGVSKEIIVMFVVIQNFEAISKKFNPLQLHAILNYFYNEMHKVVQVHEGTLDKIISPAFMVIWNHPIEQPNAEKMSIDCAKDLILKVKEIFIPFMEKNGLKDFSIGIGINSGPAVAGNIGCQDFMDYTVIGDTINTGQRLEANAGANEVYINVPLYKKVFGSKRPTDKLIEVIAKGKSKPLNVINFDCLAD